MRVSRIRHCKFRQNDRKRKLAMKVMIKAAAVGPNSWPNSGKILISQNRARK